LPESLPTSSGALDPYLVRSRNPEGTPADHKAASRRDFGDVPLLHPEQFCDIGAFFRRIPLDLGKRRQGQQQALRQRAAQSDRLDPEPSSVILVVAKRSLAQKFVSIVLRQEAVHFKIDGRLACRKFSFLHDALPTLDMREFEEVRVGQRLD
jgi:hypothetical protein